MSLKYNHTKFEQESQNWWPGMGAAGGRPRLQNLAKRQFGCLESLQRGAFAWEPTEMKDKQLGTLPISFGAQLMGTTTGFRRQKRPKSALKLTFDLGTLVVINHNEWEHLEGISTPQTPFNGPFAPTGCALGTLR